MRTTCLEVHAVPKVSDASVDSLADYAEAMTTVDLHRRTLLTHLSSDHESQT